MSDMVGGSGNPRYTREERLVIAIDLGTTQSAVAFSHCFPGEIPDVRMVNRWPGQPEASGDSKIPTIVTYQNGHLVACGAEATEYVDDDDFETATWFKLNLHPDSMKLSDRPPPYDSPTQESPPIEIPLLPRYVTLTQVYADFLGYVYNHARNFFMENTPAGHRIWTRLDIDGGICFVFAIPNGWDTNQMLFMRNCAVVAGLVNPQDDPDRIQFVTEGEASVHYALAHTQSRSWLIPGVMFAVSDAGGSTVDTTLYECVETDPKLKLQEVCASECVQAGGVFIDRAAAYMLASKLRESRFGTDEFIRLMIEEFEKKIKRVFDESQASSVIHFGRNSDNDRENGIIKGRIALDRDEVGSTYDDAMARIMNSIARLLRGHSVHHLLLVGGFGESPFLRKKLKEVYRPKGTEVVMVDEPSKKAAAEGAALWFVRQLVVARAARVTVGVCIESLYKGEFASHKRREHLAYISPMGTKLLNAFYEPILVKDTVVEEGLLLERTYYDVHRERPDKLGQFTVPLYVFEGKQIPPWCKDERDDLMPGMRQLCTLVADLSGLDRLLRRRDGINGARYWVVEFVVAISFGGTQLQAKLKWKEGRVDKEGPVTILPQNIF